MMNQLTSACRCEPSQRRRKLWQRLGGGLVFCLLMASASAEVRVFIQESNSLAWVRYECTAGEVVRAFALDVTVDNGQIVGISDFLRGPSTAATPGYGIFPASFRDHLTVGPGTNVNWNVTEYTPLASASDNPEGTQPGLNSAGVTLELGGLWDPADPAAIPSATGTLCALQISEAATVSVAANAVRGGVASTNPSVVLTPIFTGAVVHPTVPEITGISLEDGILRVSYAGGELETAPTVWGDWTGTGNTTGEHSEPITSGTTKFYRVRSP